MDFRTLGPALACIVVAACSRAPDYPKDWPAPSPDLAGCPDLRGSYDGARDELPSLVAPGQDFGKRFYHEHSVLIERDKHDGHYTLTLRRNERGLAEFADWHQRYNQNSTADGGFVRIELEKGEDYSCSHGWLIGTKWQAMVVPRGDPVHVRLAFAKDRAGNLVAGVTTRKSSAIMWGDTVVVPLGEHDHTQWLRWARRPPEADAALREVGSVSLMRYPWANGGGTLIPTRFANYTADTICVDAPQMEHWEVRAPVRPPLGGTPRTASASSPQLRCARGEQRLDQGDVARIAMRKGEYTTVSWYPLVESPGTATTIDVDAPEDLPVLNSEE
jgi:hypothetical protein